MAETILARLKSLEADITSGASKTVSYLEHSFITNAKAWIAIAAVVLILVLHKIGFDSGAITVIYNLTLVLLVLHYVGQYIVDIGNAYIEGKRIQYLSSNDGAPAPLTVDGIAVDSAITTLVDKVAPKPNPAA
jgi:hypothetical protein